MVNGRLFRRARAWPDGGDPGRGLGPAGMGTPCGERGDGRPDQAGIAAGIDGDPMGRVPGIQLGGVGTRRWGPRGEVGRSPWFGGRLWRPVRQGAVAADRARPGGSMVVDHEARMCPFRHLPGWSGRLPTTGGRRTSLTSRHVTGGCEVHSELHSATSSSWPPTRACAHARTRGTSLTRNPDLDHTRCQHHPRPRREIARNIRRRRDRLAASTAPAAQFVKITPRDHRSRRRHRVQPISKTLPRLRIPAAVAPHIYAFPTDGPHRSPEHYPP